MDKAALKKGITEKVNQINDPEILKNLEIVINEILTNDQVKDFWSDIPDQIKKSIERAEKELDEGKGIDHEKAMKEIQSRFKSKA